MKQEMLTYGNRFNVRALAGRLTGVTRWMLRHPAAALWAAAAEPRVQVAAIACQDGRPDLAWPRLGLVRSPTLLIVDGHDEVILGLNRRARQQLSCESDLAVIAGYARLPGEPGAREQSCGAGRRMVHPPFHGGNRRLFITFHAGERFPPGREMFTGAFRRH